MVVKKFSCDQVRRADLSSHGSGREVAVARCVRLVPDGAVSGRFSEVLVGCEARLIGGVQWTWMGRSGVGCAIGWAAVKGVRLLAGLDDLWCHDVTADGFVNGRATTWGEVSSMLC